MKLIAIDPGTEASGLVVLDGRRVVESDHEPNIQTLFRLRVEGALDREMPVVACEMVGHYGTGMPVGREVFETVEWIGRFREAWESRGGLFVRVYRRQVKQHLCGSAKAKDANVRQALIDRYGGKEVAIGRKREPGPLFGVSGHAWQALAVGLTAVDLDLDGAARHIFHSNHPPAGPALFEEETNLS